MTEADAPSEGIEAPAVSAQEVVGDDGAEAETVTSEPADPSPTTDGVSPPSTDAANDNDPPDELPAIGTE